MNSKNILIEKEIAWEPAGQNVRRQIMGYDKNLMVVKVEFQTGAVGSEHTHPHTQSTYVAKGKFEVNIDGEKSVISQGDGFLILPGVNHGCVCLEEGILIDAFSPCREDFLKK
ncbi:quercetin dioxygenase-like cupin family protein [Elusimicrobium posterum]|uniref:cupin domain-containing protein n=1 Tax=Elusimicrobium posterum TaxID=3116653 RepID=UPI003C77CB07